MLDEGIDRILLHGGQAQQPQVVAQLAGEGGFAEGLGGSPADAGDADDGPMLAVGEPGRLLRRQFQHRAEQADRRLADGKLGGVHADGTRPPPPPGNSGSARAAAARPACGPR